MKINFAEITIAPSFLASNQSCLGQEAERAEHAGADRLHLDIMDGHFFPTLSFGSQVVNAIHPLTKLFFTEESNVLAAQQVLLYRAKCNGAARQGEYKAEMEWTGA